MNRALILLSLVLSAACSSNADAPSAATPTDSAVTEVAADTSPLDTSSDAADGGLACDVVKQDCKAGQKCSLFIKGSQRLNRCVDVTGSKMLDELCTRTSDGTNDCAKGLYCTVRPGPADGETHCKAFCNVEADCSSIPGDVCSLFTIDGRGGTCVPKCTPFGTDCATGTHCSPGYDPDKTKRVPVCVPESDPVGVGGDCLINEQCLAGLACTTDETRAKGTCATMCDPTHPCATGTCTSFDVPAGGLGYCK